MLEIVLVLSLLFLIFTFFYKQAIHEFRIHQWDADASLQETLYDRSKERIPVVLRKLPRMGVWSQDDVLQRDCYARLPLFQEYGIQEWLRQATSDSICPWRYEQAETLAKVSTLSIWEKQWLRPLLFPTVLSFSSPLSHWSQIPRFHCWAGRVPLRKTFAMWTCILPVEGEIVVTLLPESMELFLPSGWNRTFPSEWTKRDTPFVADIKYLDVVVRPGTGLFMPPHWFVSWGAKEAGKAPMVCTVSYHSPVSLLAFHLSGHSRD